MATMYSATRPLMRVLPHRTIPCLTEHALPQHASNRFAQLMRQERIELPALGLWDLRAANCATAAVRAIRKLANVNDSTLVCGQRLPSVAKDAD